MPDSEFPPLALVTGASQGLGLELARQFACEGFELVIVADDAEILDLALELRQPGGPRVWGYRMDLSRPEGVERIYHEVRRMGRPLDVLAINAGLSRRGAGGEFGRPGDLEGQLRLLRLDVMSTVYLARLWAPDMARQKSGILLFGASIVPVLPPSFEAVFAASKSFVGVFAEHLRRELRGAGVSVMMLNPEERPPAGSRSARSENPATVKGRLEAIIERLSSPIPKAA